MKVAYKGKRAIANFLIKNGADIELTDGYGRTAIFFAAEHYNNPFRGSDTTGQIQIIKLLIVNSNGVS